MSRVRISVLRTAFYPDLADAYLTEGAQVCPCPFHKEGESFVYEGEAVMPAGLCPWAWVDIYRGVASLSAGSTNTPWNSRDGETVYCCTDGIRPVTFLLKRMEE